MKKNKKKYIIFDKKPKQCLNFDKFDSYLNDTIEGKSYPDPFLFRKCHDGIQFPQLTKPTNKYLIVPASSAALDQMFSFSGDILTSKRPNCLVT